MAGFTAERLSDAVSLYQGDCLQVLPQLEPGSVDAVITDPPYGIDYQSDRRSAVNKFSRIKNDKRPFVWWLHGAAEALKEGGCLICFCHWSSSDTFRQCIELTGLKIGAQLVWDRMNHGMGDPTTRPAPRHDVLWFAVKGKYTLPGKRPTSMYSHMRLSGGNLTHPNEKPLSLMEALVADYAALGALVLDPFAGSGATAKAAAKVGRRCITIEQDENHCNDIRRYFGGSVQVAAVQPQPQVEGAVCDGTIISQSAAF